MLDKDSLAPLRIKRSLVTAKTLRCGSWDADVDMDMGEVLFSLRRLALYATSFLGGVCNGS